jgi:hypothetical protein
MAVDSRCRFFWSMSGGGAPAWTIVGVNGDACDVGRHGRGLRCWCHWPVRQLYGSRYAGRYPTPLAQAYGQNRLQFPHEL